MQIRRANMDDIYQMQHCNLRCLPENYNLRYYLYHILSWPQLLYVQEDYNHNVAGYVLAKMEDEERPEKSHGHITSIAVLRSHRRLGIASRVMKASMAEMEREYDANFCSLHVRKTNDAALHLYQETLGFRCANVEEKYYVDNEDAYHMKKYFKGSNPGFYVTSNRHLVRQQQNEQSSTNNASSGLGASGDLKNHSGATPTPITSSKGEKKNNADMPKEQFELVAELLEEEDLKTSGKGGKKQQQQQQQQQRGGKRGKGKR